MIYFSRFLLAIYLSLFYLWLSIPAHAQEIQTTPNLITNQWTGQSMSGNINGQHPNAIFGGVTGGPGPFLDTFTGGQNGQSGAITFSYGWTTVAQTIAINQALSGSGIQLNGYNWGWTLSNGVGGEYGAGPLYGNVFTRDAQGNVLHSMVNNYSYQPLNRQRFSGTVTYTNPYSLSQADSLAVEFVGSDGLFWAGYYGPRVENVDLRLNYTVNQCAANPLSSPTCEGYATAYFNQQCTISALYNPSCPGYAAAYFTQQCTANPLYNPACPGYQEAYFSYQCQQDGLYSTSCPNYAEAYAKKNILSQTTTNTAETTAVTTAAVTTDPVSIATTSTTTSTTSPTSVTSVTSVVSPATANTTTAVIQSVQTQSATTTTTATTSPSATTETKKTDNEIKSATAGSSSNTNAKSRVEARAKEVAKAASEATTFEAQTSTQATVVGLMGFVPGFDAYGQARIVDVNGIQMARQYSQPVVDNQRVMRQLSGASERLHYEMVDQQYRR